MKRYYDPYLSAGPGPRRRLSAPNYAAVETIPIPRPMPYSRGYFQSPSRRPRYRGGYRRNFTNRRTGGLLGIETKYLDTFFTTAVTPSTDWSSCEYDPTTFLCLNAVAQGDGATQRDGNKYVIKSIQISGTYTWNAQANQTAGDVAPTVFIALVQDKQTNATQMSSEDVFTNPNNAGGYGMASPFRTMAQSKRFKVHKTWKMTFTPPTISWDGTNVEQSGEVLPFECFLKFKKPIYVECKGTSGNYSDIVDNSLHLVANAEGNGIGQVLNYNSRIRFVG